nr:SDR family oxidoreductase [Sphingomonas sp. CDS-1]
MGRLEGKVAIITGAANGQGAAEAELFIAEGARVLLADVEETGGVLATRLGEDAVFAKIDVSDPVDWAAIMSLVKRRFGRLDILVNNAGIYKPKPMLDTDVALFDLHYRVNQLGPYLGMRAAVPLMQASGGGSIVNTSSFAGMSAYPGHFAYGTTKWALRGMTKLAAIELAPLQIRVNGIHPGMIDTAMLAENDPDVMAAYAKAVPLGRAGTAAEVAELALFLASDASSYISGAEVSITGGIG